MIPLTFDDYQKHFFGKYFVSYFLSNYGLAKENFSEVQYTNIIERGFTYAIYPLTITNECSYVVFDFDGNEGDYETVLPTVKEFKKFLDDKEIKCTIFFSGNKGYHVYLFFDGTLKSMLLRLFAENILKEFNTAFTHSTKVEIFPKQSEIDYLKKKFGNHLKAPFSNHPKTGKKSVQLSDFHENNSSIIKETTDKLFEQVDFEILTKTVAPYFVDGNRHKITIGISGYFKNSGIDKEKTLSIFERIIELSGGDKQDIFRVIDDTYATKKPVADLSYASLPTRVENTIFTFVTGLDSDELKLSIINIRATKKQTHIKVDQSVDKAIKYIDSRYRVFKDENFIYIIYGDKIYTTLDKSFDSLLLSFGFNVEETFARQVRRAITDHYYNTATYCKPINFSEYVDGTVKIYTRNSIISLSKEELIEDLEFLPVLNKKSFEYVPKEERTSKLTDILKTFRMNKQSEDLLLCWLVSQLFNENINTKPVLLIQGKPGSGKSTLSNLLVKLVEDMSSKVSAFTGKDDALIAALQNHKVLVLDNLEYITSKTIDIINAVVTGAAIELRALFTTNELVQIVPQCSLVITSAHGNFDNDGAFQSRLIRVRLPDREAFIIESEFWAEVEKNYNDYFSEILDLCMLVLQNKRDNKKTYRIRMTDFIDICKIIETVGVIKTDIETYIYDEQYKEKINNPIFKVFAKVVGDNNIYKPFTIDAIFQKFKSIALHSYGIDRITINNLGSKILKTGLFSMNEKGIYYLNSIEGIEED